MNNLQKLRDTISDNDSTQDELALKIGVNRNQIRRWITGESEMGIWKLKKICEYYNVSADYLLDLPKGMNHPR
jgi:transcriptional regulator with XRE-family HTH domain